MNPLQNLIDALDELTKTISIARSALESADISQLPVNMGYVRSRRHIVIEKENEGRYAASTGRMFRDGQFFGRCDYYTFEGGFADMVREAGYTPIPYGSMDTRTWNIITRADIYTVEDLRERLGTERWRDFGEGREKYLRKWLSEQDSVK